MKKILFVCTGNTCRSSMAEGIFNYLVSLDETKKNAYSAFSSGVAAIDGEPASDKSIRVLKDQWNIDLREHRSHSVSKEQVENAELILTMTRNHKAAIIQLFPFAKSKVYTLKEFVLIDNLNPDFIDYNFNLDILDPYGMSEEVYRKCALEIKEMIEKLLTKI